MRIFICYVYTQQANLCSLWVFHAPQAHYTHNYTSVDCSFYAQLICRTVCNGIIGTWQAFLRVALIVSEFHCGQMSMCACTPCHVSCKIRQPHTYMQWQTDIRAHIHFIWCTREFSNRKGTNSGGGLLCARPLMFNLIFFVFLLVALWKNEKYTEQNCGWIERRWLFHFIRHLTLAEQWNGSE